MTANQDASDATLSEATCPEGTFPEVTRDDIFRIETKRLWLRWPRAVDAADITEFAGLPELAEMTASWPVGVTADEVLTRISDARRWNSTGERLVLVIVAKAAPDRVIGQIGLDGENDGSLGLGYHLAPEHWGQGLMSEAVAEMTALAFKLTSAPVINTDILVSNAGSRRVLEKIGFRLTGSEISTCGLRGKVDKEKFQMARQNRVMLAVA